MKALASYVASIAFVNWAFTVLPIIGGVPVATVLVGFIFVLRDYAQRSVGHWVLAGMAAGIMLSWWLAEPAVAIASAAAFAASEGVDWTVYTLTRRPFRTRILLSSAFGTPVDSAIFLGLLPFAGAFTFQAVLLMTAIKMLAAVGLYAALPRHTDHAA